LDAQIIDLLADRSPERTPDFLLRWEERRTASWADANRDALLRAASGAHLPHARGQLRHQYGEQALAQTAKDTGFGHLPFFTTPPGGVFTLARVGRFAIASVKVKSERARLPHSVTRELLARPNDALDRQMRLLDEGLVQPKSTELAYFGCLIAVPLRRDPSIPMLAFGIPNATLDDWLYWTRLPRLHELLRDRADSHARSVLKDGEIPDRAFPKLRLPKSSEGTTDSGSKA